MTIAVKRIVIQKLKIMKVAVVNATIQNALVLLQATHLFQLVNGILITIFLISLQKNKIFTIMKPPFLLVSILYGLYQK